MKYGHLLLIIAQSFQRHYVLYDNDEIFKVLAVLCSGTLYYLFIYLLLLFTLFLHFRQNYQSLLLRNRASLKCSSYNRSCNLLSWKGSSSSSFWVPLLFPVFWYPHPYFFEKCWWMSQKTLMQNKFIWYSFYVR